METALLTISKKDGQMNLESLSVENSSRITKNLGNAPHFVLPLCLFST